MTTRTLILLLLLTACGGGKGGDNLSPPLAPNPEPVQDSYEQTLNFNIVCDADKMRIQVLEKPGTWGEWRPTEPYRNPFDVEAWPGLNCIIVEPYCQWRLAGPIAVCWEVIRCNGKLVLKTKGCGEGTK